MSQVQRTNYPANFFSEEEKEQIIKRIQAAEMKTSGEIRLHLEKNSGYDVFQRAINVFNKIGMAQTEQKNGVLIYLATSTRKFVILGDSGINEVVPENFWEDVADLIGGYFKKGKFCVGICEGIERVGDKLKRYFPYAEDDINELSNDISVSKD